ncbi:MAG: hypothetical protein ACI38Q_01750 [Candidatus Bruticola sp.]
MAVILPPYHEDDRMLSGLAYPLWPIICPIVLMGEKKNEPFVHFHIFQALGLGIFTLAAMAVIFITTFLALWLLPSSFVTFSGFVGLIIFFVLAFIFFFWFSVILYIAWQASSGKFLRLPFLGKWAEEKMQTNLGITEADYATTMIGEKKETVIDPFDYEAALEYAAQSGDDYAKSELDSLNGPEYIESEVVGDPESIEYSRRGSGDISEYLQPEVSPAKQNSFKATATASGPSSVVNESVRGGFKPLTPQSGRMTAPQPSVRPRQQPVVPPTASSPVVQSEFKPLSTAIRREVPKVPPIDTGASSVRFNSDFSAPSAGKTPSMPYRPAQTNRSPRSNGTSDNSYPPGSRPITGTGGFTPGLSSRVQQPPSGEPDFTPGIISRPTARQSNRGFQWNELDSGQ